VFEIGSKVIAEIGQNHNGCIAIAKRLVDMAKHAGCYAVKSAKRDPACFPEKWKGIKYNNGNSFGENYYEHRMALELNYREYEELRNYAKSNGLIFGSSFTDLASLNFLCDIGVDYLKVASSRVPDAKLLEQVNERGLPVMLSTGGCNMDMVQKSMYALKRVPYLVIMQCTMCYPTKADDLHLSVLKNYASNLGFSSHSAWLPASLIAIGLGVEWFEYHVTTNSANKGTDHCFSLELPALRTLCDMLSIADKALGNSTKTVLECEREYIKKLRSDIE